MAKKFNIRPAGSALGVQGVVFFQGRGYTIWYAERLKKHDNAADGIFYLAITFLISYPPVAG